MIRLLVASVSALAVAAPAWGAGEPRAIELGQGVEGRVGKGELDCYQIDAPKGATLSVGVDPKGFAPNVQVLRGARCDADVPQFEMDGTANGGADLPFKSVGGRYLVVVRAKSGGGAYRLKVSNSTQVAERVPAQDAPAAKGAGAAPVAPSGELAAAITAGLSKEEADKLIGGVAPPPEKPVDPKVALMRKQLAGYKEEQEKERLRREEEARRAEEERIRRQEEEEERREQQRQANAEREANNQAMWGAIMSGVQQVAGAYVEAKQQRFEAQQRLNQLARERDQANAAKAAEQQRQANEARQNQINAQKAAEAQMVANAYAQRQAMIARATDPNVKRQLEAQQQGLLDAARRQGVALPAGASSGGGSGPLTVVAGNQQQQSAAQRAQAEQAQRQKEQAEAQEAGRKREEAIAKANADRARQQEEQRKQQEAMRKQQEEAQRKMQAQMLLNQHARGGMSTVGLGAVPKGATPPGSGDLSQGVSNIGQCKASNVSVHYNLGVIMGEATVNGVWRWEGEPGCTPPHNTAVWLRLQNGSAYGFVKIAPGVTQAGKSMFNVAESPAWSQLVCSFSGSGPTGCMSEAQAKALWANGQVTSFVIAW